jgi:hypothetical protein
MNGGTMTVGQLIRKLNKLPKNLQVGIAAHDNYPFEIAGWVNMIQDHSKEEHAEEVAACNDDEARDIFKANPDRWVTLHC